jgi:hypothetical protein
MAMRNWKALKDNANVWLFRMVDGASLAVFRIFYGLILFLESVTLFFPSNSAAGRVPLDVYYRDVSGGFHFPYPGFEWLPMFPSEVMSGLAVMMGICGLAIATGLLYRASAITGFLIWMYFYLVESTRTYWMSHYYLMDIIGLVMCFLPAARRWSVDGLIFPGDKSACVPMWSIAVLRFQLVVTYFYAGMAKVNADWLLDFQPVGYFLSQPHVDELPGFIANALSTRMAAAVISWSGALFDLLIGFVMLMPAWRITGMVFMVLFHAMNHFLLFRDIGWFPLLGILTSFIFFAPSWPVRFCNWFGARLIPASDSEETEQGAGASRKSNAPLVLGAVGLWAVIQIAVPLRHLLIPGDARFTFEGLAFSWRLKAEVYRSMPARLNLLDKSLVEDPGSGQIELHWDRWEGRPVICREFDPAATEWSDLPALLIVDEPVIGQRIIFNPLSSDHDDAPLSLRKSLETVFSTWDTHYGRKPDDFQLSISTDKLIESWRNALRIKGLTASESDTQILRRIIGQHASIGDGKMLPLVRRLHPFEIEGMEQPSSPLLIITDNRICGEDSNSRLVVRTAEWKSGALTGPDRYLHHGAQPSVIHLAEIPALDHQLAGRNIPEYPLMDRLSTPSAAPMIRWPYLRELNTSKAMHMSTQPFLLREYAGHVADQWEQRTGTRPAVFAETLVSLNGRPVQRMVDPETDLAGTTLRIMRHHEWIRDLELKRIPAAGRLPGFSFEQPER